MIEITINTIPFNPSTGTTLTHSNHTIKHCLTHGVIKIYTEFTFYSIFTSISFHYKLFKTQLTHENKGKQHSLFSYFALCDSRSPRYQDPVSSWQ